STDRMRLSRRSLRLLSRLLLVYEAMRNTRGSPGAAAYTAPPAGVSSPIKSLCTLPPFSEMSTCNIGGSRPNGLRSAAFSSTTRSAFRDETAETMPETSLWSAPNDSGAMMVHLPAPDFVREMTSASFFFRSILVMDPLSILRIDGESVEEAVEVS